MDIKKSIRRRISTGLCRSRNHRRFIDSALGVAGFLRLMKEEGVDYVVLRWFEFLPQVDPGEDIDILVDDEDVEVMASYMKVAGKKGDIPCDIYSVSGLSGSSSRGMPYYPVPIARKILDNAVWVNDLVRAPSPDDYYLSLSYHVIYHKGYSAGIPSEDEERNRKVLSCSDHDYVETLKRLSRKSSLELEDLNVTLEALDRVLSDAGWKPAYDTLEKISANNQWVSDILSSEKVDVEDFLRGLSIFIVREKGSASLDDIRRILFDQGFDHVLEGKIPEDKVIQTVNAIRGGNWGKGPWPKSGGLPTYYYVVYDAMPIQVSDQNIREHPGLDNERILIAKEFMRDYYNSRVAQEERCNIVHSADNAYQTILYLSIINSDAICSVKEEAKRKFKEFITPYEVVANVSKNARRAKVELINFHGRKAICKTFKEGRERYLDREIMARMVGDELSEVSRILEVGRNYIVIEFYDGSIDDISRMRPLFHSNPYLPIWVVKRMREIIIYYRRRGYECIDFSPTNVIFDANKGLKVIDFEFLQKVGGVSEGLYGNFAWYSTPEDFEGDLPQGKVQGKRNRSLYRTRWFRYTGLPVYFCVNDYPKAVLHLIRAGTFLYFSVNNARRKALSRSINKLNLR